GPYMSKWLNKPNPTDVEHEEEDIKIDMKDFDAALDDKEHNQFSRLNPQEVIDDMNKLNLDDINEEEEGRYVPGDIDAESVSKVSGWLGGDWGGEKKKKKYGR